MLYVGGKWVYTGAQGIGCTGRCREKGCKCREQECRCRALGTWHGVDIHHTKAWLPRHKKQGETPSISHLGQGRG